MHKRDKKTTKKVLYWALTNTDFLPRRTRTDTEKPATESTENTEVFRQDDRIFNHEGRKHKEELDRITGFTEIMFLPGGADLAAAFSIQSSAKPAAIVRWAIRDGPHKNMQAGKKREILDADFADSFDKLRTRLR